MSRGSYPYRQVAFTFGPGGITPAVKMLILANIGGFLLQLIVRPVTIYLGLTPAAVFGELWVWQIVTYMFLHGGIGHILFNMLALWMFGVELERQWGTVFFLKYYFVTGIGAGATTLLLATLPFGLDWMYYTVTIGASGAIYGLLIAYALYFPNRPIYMYLLFAVPAKYFVLIIGAIAFLLSVSDARGGIAHAAHLGGLVVGYFYLTRGRGGPIAELKYRYLRWRMSRMRRKFDVYSGGRKHWTDRIH